MVTLTINGQPVEVAAGTTVLAAARQAGIVIPTLCDHPALKPSGGCRLCVVEVQGARGPQTACTLQVSQDMAVTTDTPALREHRQFVLNMLFSESNHICPYCVVSGGDCELQNAAYQAGMTHWAILPAWQARPLDASGEHFIFDPSRCILCRRCVRACAELVGNGTLGMAERGAQTKLVADGDVPFGQSSCVACGTCLQVCPTGALYGRRDAYQGNSTQTLATASICVGCSVGCGIRVITRDGRLVRVEGDWAAPVNGGVLCEVGRFAPQAETRQRVLTPLVRQGGQLAPAGWDEALARAAAGLPGAAGLASTRLPVEALAAFRDLMDQGLGSPLLTSIEEGRTNAAATPAAHAADLAALETADLVIVWGADLSRSHQVAGFLIKRRLEQGLKLVVIDPAETPLALRANQTLQPAGTDALLVQALQAALRGPAAEAEAITLARQAGVPAEAVLTLAGLLSVAERPVLVYGKGLTAYQPEAVRQLPALAQKVGRLRLLGLHGEANSRAAQRLLLDRPFEPVAGQPVLLVLGDDHAPRRLQAAVQAAPFLVVAATYHSPLTERADVVLPVAGWLEQSGHYLNLEGRLQAAHAALAAPAQVQPAVAVLAGLAARVGLVLDADWQAQMDVAFEPGRN